MRYYKQVRNSSILVDLLLTVELVLELYPRVYSQKRNSEYEQ